MAISFAVVGIAVADMSRSLSFYRTLGPDIPSDADGAPHVEVVLPGGVRIAWDTSEVMSAFDPDWSLPTGSGHSLSLAFACSDSAEVDATYAAMTSAGFVGHLPPWNADWGQRYAPLRDPEGNTVDLFAAADSSR